MYSENEQHRDAERAVIKVFSTIHTFMQSDFYIQCLVGCVRKTFFQANFSLVWTKKSLKTDTT